MRARLLQGQGRAVPLRRRRTRRSGALHQPPPVYRQELREDAREPGPVDTARPGRRDGRRTRRGRELRRGPRRPRRVAVPQRVQEREQEEGPAVGLGHRRRRRGDGRLRPVPRQAATDQPPGEGAELPRRGGRSGRTGRPREEPPLPYEQHVLPPRPPRGRLLRGEHRRRRGGRLPHHRVVVQGQDDQDVRLGEGAVPQVLGPSQLSPDRRRRRAAELPEQQGRAVAGVGTAPQVAVQRLHRGLRAGLHRPPELHRHRPEAAGYAPGRHPRRVPDEVRGILPEVLEDQLLEEEHGELPKVPAAEDRLAPRPAVPDAVRFTTGGGAMRALL
mmetsp:Transcript_35357/g.79361  ORF Transcript_35357/g.79361 Transcript_35357/m.79361 type:complete len:330 (+) Transcript_35357:864-1853(+)